MPDRQNYISGELTHFVGRSLRSDEERYECLKRILTEGLITHSPHDGSARRSGGLLIQYKRKICESTNEMFVPNMVCFCDIPLKDLRIHVQKYSPFGVAFGKQFIASRGGAPVYYVPKHAGRSWPEAEGPEFKRGHVFDRDVKKCYDLLEELICDGNEWSNAATEVQTFLLAYVFAYIRCFDHNLPDEDPGNYYFEREWRILRCLEFGMSDVWRVLLPKEYAPRFRTDFPAFSGDLTFL